MASQRGFAAARRHIGLYAYRVAALRRLSLLPPSPLELVEKLEQLRALENGMEIRVADAVEIAGPGREHCRRPGAGCAAAGRQETHAWSRNNMALPGLEFAQVQVGDVARAIQLSLTPVFLLNGVGVLLAMLTTRLARIVDRARILEERLPTASEQGAHDIHAVLDTTRRRARLMNRAITLGTVAALLVALLVALMFAAEFAPFPLGAGHCADLHRRDAGPVRFPVVLPDRSQDCHRNTTLQFTE